jgi:hypothetical protein
MKGRKEMCSTVSDKLFSFIHWILHQGPKKRGKIKNVLLRLTRHNNSPVIYSYFQFNLHQKRALHTIFIPLPYVIFCCTWLLLGCKTRWDRHKSRSSEA